MSPFFEIVWVVALIIAVTVGFFWFMFITADAVLDGGWIERVVYFVVWVILISAAIYFAQQFVGPA